MLVFLTRWGGRPTYGHRRPSRPIKQNTLIPSLELDISETDDEKQPAYIDSTELHPTSVRSNGRGSAIQCSVGVPMHA